MQQKALLISSMQKLIKHIGTNKKNQEDIFNSLSSIDLNKIVSNLEDVSTDLRKTSFELIGCLLFDNYPLKKILCAKVGVGEMTGRIILNPKQLSTVTLGLADFLKLLKQPMTLSESSFTLWYVNLACFPRKIEYMNKSGRTIDPKDWIVGLIFPQPSLELLKEEAPIMNSFTTGITSPTESNSTIKQTSLVPCSTGSYDSGMTFGSNYTAGTINNFNTHNNYYTITGGDARGHKTKNQSLREEQKGHKEAPISIKKMNYNRANHSAYGSSNYKMKGSVEFSSEVIHPINRNIMASSNIVAERPMGLSTGLSGLKQEPFIERNNQPIHLHPQPKPMSVTIRDPERAHKYQPHRERGSQPHQPFVPQIDIKNRFLQSPVQSSDRDYKDINNPHKYGKRY